MANSVFPASAQEETISPAAMTETEVVRLMRQHLETQFPSSLLNNHAGIFLAPDSHRLTQIFPWDSRLQFSVICGHLRQSAVKNSLRGFFQQAAKVCPKCKRRFETLRDYLLVIEHLGPAMPYDADDGDWNPVHPIGTITYANCRCGTTLALSSNGMPLRRLWILLNWARVETKKRGMTPQELLNYLRVEITRQVLAGPCPDEVLSAEL